MWLFHYLFQHCFVVIARFYNWPNVT